MAPDSDELEQALEENLRLRSELAANVAKAEAAIQRGGMAYRLGKLLYWIYLTLALLAGVAFLAMVLAMISSPDAPIGLVITPAALALALYGVGRAFRYVLSGE